MRSFLCFVLLLLPAYAINARASNCDGNSCWSIVNNSNTGVSINCVGYGEENFFTADNLLPAQTYAEQYDSGFGDGLGFPEPHVWFTCFINTQNHKKATVNFSTINWGDSVKFFVTDSEVLLRQKGWSDERETSVKLR